MSILRDGAPGLTRKAKGCPRRWLAFVILPLAGLVVGSLAGIAVTLAAPHEYESMAVVRINPPAAELQLISGGPPGNAGEQLVVDGPALVGSSETIDLVVESLDLTGRWAVSAEEARERLRDAVTSTGTAGTGMLEIRVRDPDPETAHELAGALVRAFAGTRGRAQAEWAEQALGVLESEMEKQEAALEEEREKLQAIVRGVAGSGGGARKDSADEQGRRDRLEGERRGVEESARRIEALEGEARLKFAASLQLMGNEVPLLFNELLLERRELDHLHGSGIGEAHPQFRSTRARIEVLRGDLERAVAALRETLRGEIERLDDELRRGELRPEREGAGPIEEEVPDAGSAEAWGWYEAARERLTAMRNNQTAQRVRLQLPSQPVTIYELPKAPAKPVRMNPGRNLAFGSVTGGLAGIACALVVAFWKRKGPG